MRKHIFFFLLWILVGVLGFALGMKWSVLSDREQKPGKDRLHDTASTQTGKIVVSQDSGGWETILQMDVTMIEKTIQMLREEYVEDIQVEKLLNSALKGVKSHLESRKLKSDFVKPLPLKAGDAAVLTAFKKTFSEVMARYGGKIKEQDLTYAALKGLMDGLEDPYSVALEPREYRMLNEQMSGGNYGGIGVYVELSRKNNNTLTVLEPIEGSPAQKAGLKPGDLVLKIDNISTKGMDLEVAAQKIRGEVGSSMTMTIQRKNNPVKTYTMKRDLIHVSSVTSNLKPGNIGYIRIRFFGDETDGEFAQALEKVKSLGAKSVVIDLRNNGGGYISAAIDVCSKLLQGGTLIVSVVNKRTGRHEVHKASGSEQINMPMAVLVNDLSASAAEITAGALKDTKTGVLVGEKTFGKGSVQTIHELRDGGALKYTIAKYLTPLGIDINKKGITPDLPVKMEPAKVESKEDVQLQEALSYLKKRMQ